MIKEIWNNFATKFNDCNKELTKLIGKKSVYDEVNLNDDFFRFQWIEFYYSRELTNDEKKKVIDILTKYFGKLDRPNFTMKYKTEKNRDGELRWDTYNFFSYLSGYKAIK